MRSPRPIPVAVLLAVCATIFGTAYALPYLLAPVEADFARDLDRAYRIAAGEAWLTTGPQLAGSWHLGPAWYYVLALPMRVFGSMTGIGAWIALLAALKFPLAYRLGRGILDARLGYSWAIMLALPGVSTLESVWIAHPSLVGTTSLAVAYALWRAWHARSYRWLYAACLLFGLALHAHPTTLPLGALAALTFYRLGRVTGVPIVGPVVIGAALSLLPFAPLLADWREQAAELFAFSHGVAAASSAWNVRDLVTVSANVYWHVPGLIVTTYLGIDSPALAAWNAFLALLHAGVIVGLGMALWRADLGLRHLAAAGIAYTIFCALVVFAVRTETRFYMLYALLPPIAFVQAVGLTACARSGLRALRTLSLLLLVATLAAFLAIAAARLEEARQGYVRLPAVFGENMDLRAARSGGFAQLDSLPLWALDALGRTLCTSGNVHAYGDLALIVDSQFNIPARLQCDGRSRVLLGGEPKRGEAALFALPAREIDEQTPAQPIGALRVGTVASVLRAGRPVAIASGDEYPARETCMSTATHDIAIVADGARSIVISSSLAAVCPIKIRRITVDREAVTPVRRSLSYFARAPAGAPGREWRLEIDTGDISAVHVFTLPSASP